MLVLTFSFTTTKKRKKHYINGDPGSSPGMTKDEHTTSYTNNQKNMDMLTSKTQTKQQQKHKLIKKKKREMHRGNTKGDTSLRKKKSKLNKLYGDWGTTAED
jgi:hypothetical protein